MAALKTRRTAPARAGRIPDDRDVVGCALTALAALLLMLLAGAAKAEQPDFVCWDRPNGALECESFASVKATCVVVDNKHELCEVVQSDSSSARLYFPGNTKYTTIKLTRAGLEKWDRYKPHMN